MITSASENKELAYHFLEYMVQAKTQKLVADVTILRPGESAGWATDDRRAAPGLASG